MKPTVACIYIALPEEDGSNRLVVCDADGEPTDDRIPTRVRHALRTAEGDGLVPGSYVALWTDDAEDGVRVGDYEGEPAPYDLAALWDGAEMLP